MPSAWALKKSPNASRDGSSRVAARRSYRFPAELIRKEHLPRQCKVRDVRHNSCGAATPIHASKHIVTERGSEYDTGEAFYRAESAQARDLAVLAAIVLKKNVGHLKVIDGMCGCGGRTLRYFVQAGADLVWANDIDPRNRSAIESNIVRSLGSCHRSDHKLGLLRRPVTELAPISASEWTTLDDYYPDKSARGCEHIGLQRNGTKVSKISSFVRSETSSGASAELRSVDASEVSTLVEEQDCHSCYHGQVDSAVPERQLSEAGDGGSSQSVDQSPSSLFYPPENGQHGGVQHAGSLRRARISHIDGKRLLTACYLAEDFYDLIDLDIFGADSTCIGPALDAIRFGGLLYLTSTDGFSSSGKRPMHALATYGAFTRSHPSANEQGLRMLIGAAWREAASRGLRVQPLFSLYSSHGPVFRAMLRVTRGKGERLHNYGFLGYSHVNGSTREINFKQLGAVRHPAADGTSPEGPLSVAGPMWTGPLHERSWLVEMAREAESRSWTGHSFEAGSGVKLTGCNPPQPLETLLQELIDESDPRLPPWIFHLREVAKVCERDIPARDKLVELLQERGYAACRSHVEAQAVKTSASFEQIRHAWYNEEARGEHPGVSREQFLHTDD